MASDVYFENPVAHWKHCSFEQSKSRQPSCVVPLFWQLQTRRRRGSLTLTITKNSVMVTVLPPLPVGLLLVQRSSHALTAE